jgi:hypothetical protein
MSETSSAQAEFVREVFLVPEDFSQTAASLLAISEGLSEPQKTIALSFLDSLRGMMRTLSLPFDFAYTEVHGLHWQRILMAERIRAFGHENEAEREGVALEKAENKLKDFLAADGRTLLREQLVERLHRLASNEESLDTARELTRQGIVLMWSAFEVLAREIFVRLLNAKPQLSERLFAHPSTRKRFTAEKVDWQTLAAYSYDLSSSMGSLLVQRADLDDIQTVRETYGALFPEAAEMARALGDERLWTLFQKRNLIVHRRGIVDRQYLEKTGARDPIASQLVVTPGEIEAMLSAVLLAGERIIEEAANDG